MGWRRIRAAGTGLAVFWVIAAGLAAEATASPYIHAHRGGPLATEGGKQVPTLPEETPGTYKQRAKQGFVLEIDVKLTADQVPVVIHDASLDRTTDCEGNVASFTAAQLRDQCEVDVAGTGGTTEPLGPGDERREPVPTLAEVLKLAVEQGSEVNLEIKNLPTDPDFDPAVPPAYAQIVAAEIKRSSLPPSKLIVQSFYPPNLDVIEADPYFDDAATSFLTLEPTNAGGPAFADGQGYDYISPAWPVDQAYVSEAHGLGLLVVPYTIDDAAGIKQATELGVDAVITNDPGLAREAVKQVELPRPPIPPPPSERECQIARADRLAPPIESLHPDDGPRVFALQFKQELQNVTTYEDFRTKIECMVLDYVVPQLDPDRANIVALNEDVGLMTLATGTRGAAAREIFGPEGAPGCEGRPAPCGVAAAIGAIQAGYADQLAAYRSRYPDLPALGGTFVAGTDTFGRGWMQVFSDMAKRYGVYILGSNNQSPLRESRDPAEVATFADPDIPDPDSVYVATRPLAYNEVFMWGPDNVRKEGPRILRNVVTQNKKVPVTPIEETIQIANGPSTGPDAIENLSPYKVPGTKARISFATSLPAFVYSGVEGRIFGDSPPAGVDPCSNTRLYYMSCMEKLGANLVMQDEANPGRWATTGDFWQPLEWMSSTWRAAADPNVSFTYNVTPHMVGNLADLPFDGQTAITQRGLRGKVGGGCTYVGNTEFLASDPKEYEVYSGDKTEFLALAPWVADDGPRAELREVGGKLAPGSGDELENDYLETALIADLPFPPDPKRASCNAADTSGGGGPGDGSGDGGGEKCANRQRGTTGDDDLRGTGAGDSLDGRSGDDRLRGFGGRDCLRGQAGDDRLQGGEDRDRLIGGSGADRARGGSSRDVIKGGSGPDRLVGGGGRDRIKGGAGRDQVSGSKGDDKILVVGGGRDRVRCGAGRDRVTIDREIDRAARSCERVIER